MVVLIKMNPDNSQLGNVKQKEQSQKNVTKYSGTIDHAKEIWSNKQDWEYFPILSCVERDYDVSCHARVTMLNVDSNRWSAFSWIEGWMNIRDSPYISILNSEKSFFEGSASTSWDTYMVNII